MNDRAVNRPPFGWRRREDGVVVGVFPHHRVAYLRRELGALQRLVRKRLDTMPTRQPFDGVELEISARLPDDPRLLALLEHCNDSDPDWLVQWWEADLWRELDAHADVALSEVLTADTEDGWVELHDPDQLEAVVEAVGALSVIAEHRFGGPGDEDLRPHGWVSGWLRHVSWSLAGRVIEQGASDGLGNRIEGQQVDAGGVIGPQA